MLAALHPHAANDMYYKYGFMQSHDGKMNQSQSFWPKGSARREGNPKLAAE